MFKPAGGVLRGDEQRSVASGLMTHARIAEDVAQHGARRIGVLAALTAITVVGAAVLHHTLQPEISFVDHSLLYRLSAVFIVLAGAGLAALQRAELVSPQDLLDLGLVFEVAGAFALALIENAAPWPDAPVRGSTVATAWIAICVIVIPNRPWKSITAASYPLRLFLRAPYRRTDFGYPALPWNRLCSYALGPFFVVGWTPLISIRLHRLHEDLSRSEELGSYHLERLLGRGGMGEVWLARHRLLRREAAVKLVLAGLLEHAGHSERRQIQKRFESEAQAIASLRSPQRWRSTITAWPRTDRSTMRWSICTASMRKGS